VSKRFLFSASVVLIALSPLSPAVQDFVGPASREAILEHCPAWRDRVAAYQPDAEALNKLRGLGREVRIEVYFGSWCSDSEAHVSEFFKVLDLLDSPAVQAIYVGVPRDKAKRAPFYQEKDIVRLPTFVVLVDGREAGRIIETPERTIEEDLVKILGL
jgi:hypothetical protein